VDKQGIGARSELVKRAREAIEFNSIAAMRAMAIFKRPPDVDGLIERCLADLKENGRLKGEERLVVTKLGRKHLGNWA
jgi:hypothetical protein